MKYKNIKSLKKAVGEILRDFPVSRNSDIALTCRLWVTYFPELVQGDAHGINHTVKLRDLFTLPREDEIGRIRRKYQEAGQYLPTDEAVVRARKLSMDEWRVAMGYPTEESAGTYAPSYTPPSEKGRPKGVGVVQSHTPPCICGVPRPHKHHHGGIAFDGQGVLI